MRKINLEIKAKVEDLKKVEQTAKKLGARKIGVLKQKDTYFKTLRGRLKLREVEGLEKAQLIYYERENIAKPKKSNLFIIETSDPKLLKKVLGKALGIKVVVEKVRKIYNYKGTKIHLDKVKGLGTYLEFEKPIINIKKESRKAHETLRFLMEKFGVRNKDLQKGSYSDLLLKKKETVKVRFNR
ncbi:adenylate cyclase [Candidatus Bathyarchaeota archaeon]|nr:MAG: adenylate cyclase [Candidatus Bathyarchaeota archaeon]